MKGWATAEKLWMDSDWGLNHVGLPAKGETAVARLSASHDVLCKIYRLTAGSTWVQRHMDSIRY